MVNRSRSGIPALLLATLFLGLSCSGPAPDRGDPSAPAERPARVYHVQLDMTHDKKGATQSLSRGLTWWDRRPEASLPQPLELPDRPDDSPVSIVWKAPYYRVRLGPFASRSAAETVLAAARSSFPEAFVVPERLRSSR